MTPATATQIDTIVTLLGRIEAEHRGIDLDHLDECNADMLILGLVGEHLQTTITRTVAALGDAITAARTAYVASLGDALGQGADE